MNFRSNVRDNTYPIYLDLHTHTISSGHGTTDKAIELVRSAAHNGLSILGISDHGPATTGSAKSSYFRSLRFAEKKQLGIRILHGVELNILDTEGRVDLSYDILKHLDYAFISIHPPIFTPYEHPDLTQAYIKAMRHPNVRFLGHIDDDRFPVNFQELLLQAKEHNIYPEINNSSLMPNAYRVGGQKNCRSILQICKNIKLPVLLSSDSHGKENIGNMKYILPLLKELDFPIGLVINSNPNYLDSIL